MKKIIPFALLMLSGCTSNWDMQGQDPKDFYQAHPVANKVETHHAVHILHFDNDTVPADDLELMQTDLKSVSPAAAESLHVTFAPGAASEARKLKIAKILHGMGYPHVKTTYGSSNDLSRNDVKLDVAYAAIISPHCPDWRMSPVTTYSNTAYNIGCANTVNFGLMVDDPHDLVRGKALDENHDTARDDLFIDQYRSGKDMSGPAVSTSGASTPPAVGQ